MSEQLNASGGAGAPAEVLDYDKVEEPVNAAVLVDEERELAEALLEVVQKYGKFNADNTGVWAGYDSAEKNAENAAIGVKCGNCIFWLAPNGCEIIQAETEEGGLCRFAILPDGAVTAAAEDEGCPPATQDIQLNLENRQNAIDNVGYGPLNPAQPNDVFWQDKAERWNTTVREAKSARCGNCVFFVRTSEMLDCIEKGIGLGTQEAEGSIEAGELGYCNALDFKCASERTCNAWAAGGPVTDETESVTATAGSKPAPKKDRIYGSKKNKKGSAASGKGVSFSKKIEDALSEKVKNHNEKAPEGRKTSLRTLKAVYRRGAGAFSTSHRPDQNRNSWAMARVNAFLKLLKSGKPKNAKYTTDNDLLPASHPRSSKKSAEAMIAALTYQEELTPMLWEQYVPTEELGNLLEKYNSQVGPARQVDFTDLSDVAERAVIAYGYLDEDELYNAILWDSVGYMEYATQAVTASAEFYDRYQDLLPAGHPLVASGVEQTAVWLADGFDVDPEIKEALIASATSKDYVTAVHASARLNAMIYEDRVSPEVITQFSELSKKHLASN